MRALTKTECLRILQKLLPSGAAWPRAAGSTLSRLLTAFGGLFAALDQRLSDLLAELNPATALALLPEWEAFVDSASTGGGDASTLTARRMRVVAKLVEQGGLSRAYFLQLAVDLGYLDTTITEHHPTHCEMGCESAVIGETWRFVWHVNLPHQGYRPPTIDYLAPTDCETGCDRPMRDTVWPVTVFHESDNHSSFRADSCCDALVDSYAFGTLEYYFMRLKPAHTYVIFTYEGLG